MSIQGRIALATISLLLSTSLYADRVWEKISVAGAKCADGTDYNVFISKGRTDKLSIKLQGGGACWNAFTCLDIPISRKTAIEEVEEVEGFISDNPEYSPVHDYTMLYLPYCTSDAYVGTHTKSYNGEDFNHTGKLITESAINQVFKGMDLSSFDTVVVQGSSAGALGAMFHIHQIDEIVKNIPTKRFLADSPGLHFGGLFWSKFNGQLFKDYVAALKTLNFEVDRWDGNLAASFTNLCSLYQDWDFTMIQSSQDWIMSVIFGNTTQASHESLIYSEAGITELTSNPNDNCASFVPSIDEHELLRTNDNLVITAGGLSAIDYARKFIKEGAGKNYLYW